MDNVETVLAAWVTGVNEAGGCITDAVLQEKATALAKEMRETGIQVSDEVKFGKQWVSAFKKRYGARVQATHGEAGSAPMGDVQLGRELMQAIAKEINPHDLFNMDETAFNFRALPKRTISIGGVRVEGRKVDNQRMTVALLAEIWAAAAASRPTVTGSGDRRGAHCDHEARAGHERPDGTAE